MMMAASLAAGCGLQGSPQAPSVGEHRVQGTKAPGSVSSSRMVVRFKAGKAEAAIRDLSQRMGVSRVRSMPQLDAEILSLPQTSREQAVRAIASHPDVAEAEPDAIVRASLAPSDPLTPSQYALRQMSAPQAWDLSMGDPRIIVAVVDTGVDLTHPDLRDNLVPGISFVSAIEEDKTLIPIPNRGPLDDHGHGTHVAGIIAAAHNGIGITGIAPKCKIMPVKSLGYTRTGFASDVASGIVWAAEHGARVINLSLGAYGGSKLLEKAVRFALARQAVVVAAMGNDREEPGLDFGRAPSYPAALPGVIAVAASDEDDRIVSFSNAGRWCSVSAPGYDILSTTPTYPVYDPVAPDYDSMSGTSMASPYVAGVAALLLSLRPQLTPGQVKSILEKSADDIGVPGFDAFAGFGRVNAARALRQP